MADGGLGAWRPTRLADGLALPVSPKVERIPLAQTDEALRPSWLWAELRRVTGQSCMAG